MFKRYKILASLLAAAVFISGLTLAGTALAADPDVALAGAGYLKAEGDGLAQLQGKGIIAVQGAGSLVVIDLAGDARIDVEGWGEREVLGPRRVAWFGKGSALIRGSNVIVTLAGANLEVKAAGKGRARFEGTGTVAVKGATLRWTANGIEVDLPPEPAE